MDNGDRVDGTGVSEGFPTGRIYASEQAWRGEMALAEAWRRFRARIDRQGRPPAGLTIEAIERYYELLGVGE